MDFKETGHGEFRGNDCGRMCAEGSSSLHTKSSVDVVGDVCYGTTRSAKSWDHAEPLVDRSNSLRRSYHHFWHTGLRAFVVQQAGWIVRFFSLNKSCEYSLGAADSFFSSRALTQPS